MPQPEPTLPPAASRLQAPRIDPRYRVMELLGSGGMAAVWRARDERLSRDVALKVLHPHVQLSPASRQRFEREAQVAASLTHENIVQVHDYSASETTDRFIAMEYVDGQSLRMLVEGRGALPPVVVAVIAHELARGLAYAHGHKVVHRDVKPENVLLSRTGSVKLGDFGIAAVEEAQRLTATGAAVGTPAYLSPEQLRGETATELSDLFALGVVMYEMAAGRQPFAAETPSAVMFRIAQGSYPRLSQTTVDADLAQVVDRCLTGEPAGRFGSAEALAERLRTLLQARGVVDPRATLQRFLEGQQVASPLPLTAASVPQSTQEAVDLLRARSGRRLRVGLGVLFGLTLVVGTAFMAAGSGQGGRQPPRDASPPLAGPTRDEVLALPPPVVLAAPSPAAGAGASAASPAAARVESPGPGAASSPGPHAAPRDRRTTQQASATAAAASSPPEAALSAKPTVDPAADWSLPSTPTRPPAESGTVRLVVRGGWADVRVDGELKGRVPLTRSLVLPAGTYSVELTGNPMRRSVRTQVRVEPGKTVEVAAELQPL